MLQKLHQETVVQIVAYLAVNTFNGGYTKEKKMIEFIDIKIGPTAAQYHHHENKRRVAVTEKQIHEATRKVRKSEKCTKNEVEEAAEKK